MLEEMSVTPEMDTVRTKDWMELINEIYLGEVSDCWEFRVLMTKDTMGTQFATRSSEEMKSYETRAVDGAAKNWAYTQQQLDTLDGAETWYIGSGSLQMCFDLLSKVIEGYQYSIGQYVQSFRAAGSELGDWQGGKVHK
ncbi:hypothetical protein C2E23DRAFT_862632 [Lenzites betulinus]|nr:hypothetical protein C2E23DRAFT_862632 [Lenzites betulinus]